MSMGVHHPYHLDLCANDQDPSQLINRPGWDAPHVRCSPRTFCAWPCLLRQVGTVLGSPHDYVVAGLAYANPGSRHINCLLSQSLASQNSVPSGILLVPPYPETNFFHLSPPYLPTCGIPLPLLKYIIYVLSLDVQNLLFCATDSAHEEVVGNL